MTVGKLSHSAARSRSMSLTFCHASRTSGTAYWSRKASRSFSACPAVRPAGAMRAISVSVSPVATTAACSGVRASM